MTTGLKDGFLRSERERDISRGVEIPTKTHCPECVSNVSEKAKGRRRKTKRFLFRKKNKYFVRAPRKPNRKIKTWFPVRLPAKDKCRMAFLQVAHALLLLLELCNCYNLETGHSIIYRIPDDSERSYFGMSVAIRPKASILNGSWTIQIGAPRGSGEGEGVREPGTVYRCHPYGPCRRFLLDEGATDFGGSGVNAYRQKKDGAWIGVAMDIVDSGAYERSLVCGHRWMNQKLNNPENIDVTYLMTGICYLQDLFNDTFHTPVHRLLPLVNRDNIYTPNPYVVDLSTYHWGLGQAGLSVKGIDRSSDLLIGAPGVTHWIGSVIRYDGTLRPTVGHFATAQAANRNRYTYIGYAVASGRFYKDKELWYVAGAPRSSNYRGEVFTFHLKGSTGDIRLQSKVVGSTFGEYFGASLAVADLNGDSFDDLVVGAPLFSSKEADEGRIYVFLGTGRGNFLVPSQVVSGQAGAGRFGSCVSPLKDLDKDGYDDLAVGAPYEDERGAVYIYRGFPKGLQTKYSQRIGARDIYPHLRGFGVSISAAVDVDGNKYEDIAVGSYLSGHVVLFRSRPVISLHVDIRTQNITLIDRRDSHFNVTVCSTYTGSHAPEYVDVLRLLQLDPVHRRGTLHQNTSSYSKSIRLNRNHITCELQSVFLNLSQNNYSPFQITVKTQIRPCMNAEPSFLLVEDRTTTAKDEFSKTCPVGNKADYSTEIPFAGVCGPDLTCRSDLHLSCTLPHSSPSLSYVVGSTDPLVLSIQLQNHGEPAYHTRIKLWSNFKLHHRHNHNDHATPSDTPRNTFWFDLQPLLTETYRTNFSFNIDLEALLNHADQRPRLNLVAEVFTSSLELHLDNNRCKLSLELSSQAHLNFHASSSLTSVYLTQTPPQHTLNLTHYYELHKTGLTPLKDAQITIYVPVRYQTHFLSFDFETADWMQASYPSQGTDGAPQLPPFSAPFYPTPSTSQRTSLSPLQHPNNSPPANRTFYLNCSTPRTTCKALNIFFIGPVPSGLSSYLKLIISLNLTALDFLSNDKDIIHVSTMGVLTWWKVFDNGPTEIRRSASISIYEHQSEDQLNPQAVGLSLLAGGFLLTLIVAGLAKWNFFSRRKRQQLQALREADASFVYFAPGAQKPVPVDYPDPL